MRVVMLQALVQATLWAELLWLVVAVPAQVLQRWLERATLRAEIALTLAQATAKTTANKTGATKQ